MAKRRIVLLSLVLCALAASACKRGSGKLIGVIPTPTGGVTYYGGSWDVAAAFGGLLPEKWGIVVVNYSGLAIGSSGASANYQGINSTTS